MTRLIPALSLALLAACAPKVPPADTPSETTGVRCDANAASALVGQSADKAATEAQRLSGARTIRRYRTGDALTMDYRVDRLNIETDAAGTIVKLSCG